MNADVKRVLYTAPTTRDQLADYIEAFTGFQVHRTVRCNHHDPETGRPHQSQLDYIAAAFLGTYSSAVFIASRNAGKSYAAAIACLLDLWFKPGIKIAIAAYQRNQSDYIYTYLVDFIGKFEAVIGEKVCKITKDEIVFKNKSSIQFFSGGKSSAGIKGFHPDILIVDEGDLFTTEQFDGIANALEAGSKFDTRFDVLSTNYSVSGDGVILKQIEKYDAWNKERSEYVRPCRVFRVCLLDIMARCDERFQCFNEKTNAHCPLWKYCKGAAKDGEGFYKIERAMETMRDSSRPTFESQMLLLRPSSEYSYFTDFSVTDHVLESDRDLDPSLLTLISFDFGAGRCPHAVVIAQKDKDGRYWIIDALTHEGRLEDFCDRIKRLYPTILNADCFYDPAGNRKEHMKDAKSYADVLKKAGYFPRCKQLKRRQTFELMNALISPADGKPKLMLNKKCVQLVKQIQAAEHEVVKGRITPEPADGKGDDLLDALRYLIGWTCGTYAKHNGSRKLLTF